MAPKLSKRQVADLQKAAAFHGFDVPVIPQKSTPEVNDEYASEKHGFIKQIRGNKTVRPLAQRKRAALIADKLKGSLQKVEKFRQEERDRKWVDREEPTNFGRDTKSSVKKAAPKKKKE